MIDTDRVRRRLERAVADNPEYELHPPLSEDEVLAFEHEQGVTLPADYRRFLLTVCSGFVNDGAILTPFPYVRKEMSGPLSTPFPYTAAYSARIRARWAASPEVLLSDLMQDESLRREQVGGMPPGCLVLADFGGEQSVIVVSGEERGRIWRIGDFDTPEDLDLIQQNGDHETLIDFERWVEGWLGYNGLG
jgi:hypothetical protein